MLSSVTRWGEREPGFPGGRKFVELGYRPILPVLYIGRIGKQEIKVLFFRFVRVEWRILFIPSSVKFSTHALKMGVERSNKKKKPRSKYEYATEYKLEKILPPSPPFPSWNSRTAFARRPVPVSNRYVGGGGYNCQVSLFRAWAPRSPLLEKQPIGAIDWKKSYEGGAKKGKRRPMHLEGRATSGSQKCRQHFWGWRNSKYSIGWRRTPYRTVKWNNAGGAPKNFLYPSSAPLTGFLLKVRPCSHQIRHLTFLNAS
jgi:hypothetical protein